jgi:mono/diheme cytochrome c family protein
VLSYAHLAGLALAALPALLPGPAAATESPFELGDYLINGIVACGNCHTPQGPEGPLPGMELAGGLVIQEPEFTVVTPNITPDPETGIGRWSDEQIIAAIREGRRPDGSIIGPPMPIGLYRQMADRDVEAIVVYLRQVPAVRNEVPRTDYPFPLPESYGQPVGAVGEVPRDDPVKWGTYLAGPLGHCIECHTPATEAGADYAHRLGAGGNQYLGPWGEAISANITADPEEGIGAWTDAEIKRAISEGIAADGTRLEPPMAFAYYANMTEADLDALVAFLRTIPPRTD